MSDTYRLQFQNFRSIRDATVDIKPLTVIYGPNGSGKSSLIYGLLTLRNFLTNPAQNVPSLFSYPSIGLGGWQEVVHRHMQDRLMSLSIGISNPEELSPKFTLRLNQSGGVARMSFDDSAPSNILEWPSFLELEIAIPYSGNQQVADSIEICDFYPGASRDDDSVSTSAPGALIWNGTTLAARLEDGDAEHVDTIRKLNERANLPMELARHTGFVPLRRGFSKPTYGLSNVTPALGTEDEVASLLASSAERFQSYKVSEYVEKIAKRRVVAQAQIGTSTFTIDSVPTGAGVPVSIVNEGFGINQLLYMLTICLHAPFKIVAIEEPEIHLHPSMVRDLAIVLAEIAANEDRRLIVSTHSEGFVVALLSQIAAGKINVDDVSFMLAENREGETALTRCEATSGGQIQGGLEAFMASEVKDLANFLGLGE